MGISRSRHGRCETVLLGMPQRERELHLAVMANDREMVGAIINAKADINYPWSNPAVPSVKDSTTPLLAAVSLNHVEITLILLRAGAGVNITDRNGCTPLYKAAYHGRPVLIDILLKAGAHIDQSDKDHQSPLYICVQNAVVHSSYQAVEKLLSAGASVHKSDKNGQAPIHVAARWKVKDMIRILLKYRSHVNLTDYKGHTPLYLAVSSLSTGLYHEDLKYQVPTIKMLYSAGCDMLNLVDWLKWKGPGISADLLADDEGFFDWYSRNFSSPHSLKNLARLVIQKRLTLHHGNFLSLIPHLPLPQELHVYLSRRMFHLPP